MNPLSGFHKSTGPRTIFEPGGLSWIFERVREPSEFQFYGVYGHISNGARGCPVDMLNSKSQGDLEQAARLPTGRRPGAADMLPVPFDEELHRPASGRCPAGNRRRSYDTRFYLIRSYEVCTV